jgi:REP element-mobilizing transposase RayT
VHQQRGYQKLRKGRRSFAKHYYFISTQTHHRLPILCDDYSAQTVLNSLRWLDQHALFFLDTAVIMPDHVHILGQLDERPIERVMQQFKSFTSKQLGNYLKQRGRVWQNGYHDHAVRKDEDLNQIRRYCLNNPVRAKIVDDFHDYPYWYSRWRV